MTGLLLGLLIIIIIINIYIYILYNRDIMNIESEITDDLYLAQCLTQDNPP